MSGWFLLASATVPYQRKINLLKKKLKKLNYRLGRSARTSDKLVKDLPPHAKTSA